VSATPRALALAKVAALAAEEKIAQDVLAIDVSEQLALTDVFVIASASNERQVGAIVDEIEDRLRDVGCKPIRREGQREGRWVLIDFGDIVVHVQHADEREFYQLERLWKDCPEVDLSTVEAQEAPNSSDAADEDREEDVDRSQDVDSARS
jgi:ribosome-associated protein